MHEVLVQQVAVLILIHGGVEKAGLVLQAELPHRLLDEVKVLVLVVKVLLQVRHEVGLGHNDYQVKPKVPERISWSLQRDQLLQIPGQGALWQGLQFLLLLPHNGPAGALGWAAGSFQFVPRLGVQLPAPP